MAVEKDLKAILGKLKYSDDAKVLAQISENTKLVHEKKRGQATFQEARQR
jgi:hypothetical protein